MTEPTRSAEELEAVAVMWERDHYGEQTLRLRAERTIAACRKATALLRAGAEPASNEKRLVAAVARGELKTFGLMLCPDWKGISRVDFGAMRDVPSTWACTCGQEHEFSAKDAEILFLRAGAERPKDDLIDSLHAVFTLHGIASRSDLPATLISDIVSWAARKCREATKREAEAGAERREPDLRQQLAEARLETRMFARAADTEKAEAKHWRQRFTDLRQQIEGLQRYRLPPDGPYTEMVKLSAVLEIVTAERPEAK